MAWSSKWLLALIFAHLNTVNTSLISGAFHMPLQSHFPWCNNPESSWGCVVGIATGLWDGRSGVRIPVWTGDFFCHPASYSEGTGGFRWGIKQPGRDINQQPPFIAADKNEWAMLLFHYIPSCRGHGFSIWQGVRIGKHVSKPRMWTPSMFRHNGVIFGCWILIMDTVESSGIHSGYRPLSVPWWWRIWFSEVCLLAVLPDTPVSPRAVCLVVMRTSD